MFEECFPDTLKEEVTEFANRITPKNWNIFFNSKDIKYVPGTLNIWIWFLDDSYEDTGEEKKLAEVHEPMKVYKISFFKSFIPEAAEALKKYGDGIVSSSEIWVYPIANVDLKDTIIHLLAHGAGQRFRMYLDKRWKDGCRMYNSRSDGEDAHGPMFQRFYRILINRTEKIFGKKEVKYSWQYLQFYEKGYQLRVC